MSANDPKRNIPNGGLIYLFRTFSGITLPEEQMVPPSVSITHALGSIRSLMMRRWISLVPSKMVVSLASRQ